MSDKKTIDEFGSKLISAVRDRAIKRFDDILLGDVKAKKLLELHNTLGEFDLNQVKKSG